MSDIEKIKLAIDSIGEGKPDDYIIAPSKHAEEFASKSPYLASVLSSSSIIMTARQYEKHDQEALEAQRRFKTIFNRANATVLITGILVALILTISTLSTSSKDPLNRALLLALGIGSVVAGAIATRDLTVIKQGHLLEDWMGKRAFAETTRLGYFDAIAKTPGPANVPASSSLDLLKLEYFRRFQLDIQRAYYAKRCNDHRLEASRLLSYGSWSIAGSTIAVGLAGLLGVINTKFGAIAALAAIFTAIGTFVAMREAVFQDRRNAERYARTCTVLENLYKRLDQVRKAVYADGMKPLADFVDAVHEQLSLEHRQWLGEQSEAQGAFARLEKTLKETSAKITRDQAA